MWTSRLHALTTTTMHAVHAVHAPQDRFDGVCEMRGLIRGLEPTQTRGTRYACCIIGRNCMHLGSYYYYEHCLERRTSDGNLSPHISFLFC